MTPEAFIKRWRDSPLTERAASQSHFNDLCKLLGERSPTEADPKGESFAFEKGAVKTTGARGWADVWKRGHFAWEYKQPGKDLNAAFVQLQRYALALENPPLLIVSDRERFRIHTNWTNTVAEVHELAVEDLRDAGKRQLLKWAFSEPECLRPKKTRDQLTAEAAGQFAVLAQRLRDRGDDPHQVAHFVNRLVFCMFAEDVDLLPKKLFTKMLEAAEQEPSDFATIAGTLFKAMRRGGRVGYEVVDWFNGGLFDDDKALSLEAEDIKLIHKAADLNWSGIDPAILGTLFERGLDPGKRAQLGAHYTDRDKIMMIIDPVIQRPLMREWETTKAEIAGAVARVEEARRRRPKTQKEAQKVHAAAKRDEAKARKQADELYRGFVERLKNFRVLDPACGSGNFLYLALHTLKDIERKVTLDAEALGLHPLVPTVGPESLLGIEINPYAAELARVSIWIGEIQWMQRNGFSASRDPILRPLEAIQCRDAIINGDGTASAWPKADVIIGNPPYLGAKLMKRKLGVDMTERVRALYEDRLPGFTDLVCYWFENARAMIEKGVAARAGLVGTNSIRKNTNLPVLHRIAATTRIFNAWSEEQWTVDGASVDVSLICFGNHDGLPILLDGKIVESINPDLTTGLNLTAASSLDDNEDGAFLGIQKSGPFDVSGQVARDWMKQPTNPNGVPNGQVLKPYWNGDDLAGRPRDVWFIDLPLRLSKADASLYQALFEYLKTARYDPNDPDDLRLLPEARATARDKHARERWWEPYWPRPEMRSLIVRLPRYIVTGETAQHRIFAWLSFPVLPDKNLIVIPRDDDLMFGILHSRFHEVWSLRKGSDLEDRPRYTHTSTFATYAFPEGMMPNVPAAKARRSPRAPAIEAAAQRLNELRNAWLNPPELITRQREVAKGLLDRILPRDEKAARTLAQRTLTNLYNERPSWLAEAHRNLDAAVAAAYGWPVDLSDDDVLAKLFALNQERAAVGR